MQDLPIDDFLPSICASVAAGQSVVLTAETGAGKSTRVAPALLSSVGGQIILLQPRRLAARMVATRIADEQGFTLGAEVGFQVRFDKTGDADTRLWVKTDGMLLRQLQADACLEGIDLIILDEFHERSGNTDILLSWLRELKRELRPDLRIIIMSATMDATPVCEFLGDAVHLDVPGRCFPVAECFRPAQQREYLQQHVARIVAEALAQEDAGDILVFLPGVGEIRSCQRILEERSLGHGIEVLPLYAGLSVEEQQRAVCVCDHQRIILATNVAETSLTIAGVRTVIDSGQARIARYAAERGFDELRVEKISRYSALQRQGRAGRVAAGRCYRLWSQMEDKRLRNALEPELQRVDITPAITLIKSFWGADSRVFPWFEAPQSERLIEAEQVLLALGLCEKPFEHLTEWGKSLSNLPVHPRLAALLSVSAEYGCLEEGALIAAILSERDLRPARFELDKTEVEDDIEDRIECLQFVRHSSQKGSGPNGIDIRAAREIDKVQRDLCRQWRGPVAGVSEQVSHAHLLLAAMPDRIGKRTAAGANRVRLADGTVVTITKRSSCYCWPGQKGSDLILVASLIGLQNKRGKRVELGMGVAVTEKIVKDMWPERVGIETRMRFDESSQKVVAQSVQVCLGLDIKIIEKKDVDALARADCLMDGIRDRAAIICKTHPQAQDWLQRYHWLQKNVSESELPALENDFFVQILENCVLGCGSVADIQAMDILPWIQSALSPEQQQRVETWAPASLRLPGMHKPCVLDYSADNGPVLAARIQHLFSVKETPRIAGGHRPVLVHLLAPNGRPAQITSDLAGFWSSSYALVRKDLRGRYPKHEWPEHP